jgi:predicted GNAT family acetyltransferase
MSSALDRPIHAALSSRHADLAERDGAALRYRADISPLAGLGDASPASRAALARLLRPGDTAVLLQADAIDVPDGLEATLQAEAVQMVAEAPPPAAEDPRIVPLGEADIDEMVALATLVRPGPFTHGALRLGRFWGVRSGGRLAAMAGERMKIPGHTELSGVATHPDHQGQGLGRALSLHVMARIVAAGEVPFLHAFAANGAAIGLYERIGFRLRRTMPVLVLRRPVA